MEVSYPWLKDRCHFFLHHLFLKTKQTTTKTIKFAELRTPQCLCVILKSPQRPIAPGSESPAPWRRPRPQPALTLRASPMGVPPGHGGPANRRAGRGGL